MLRGAGVAISLPLLDAMVPAFAVEAEPAVPRRMVAIETNMGILPQFFFPEQAGADYTLSPYLERIGAHRKNFTVFSGVSLPGVTGAHAAEKCFLTGTPHPERGGFRNWVSLDQFAAEHVGGATRYPSLVTAVTNENGVTLSYTRSGAPISAVQGLAEDKLATIGRVPEIEPVCDPAPTSLDLTLDQLPGCAGVHAADDNVEIGYVCLGRQVLGHRRPIQPPEQVQPAYHDDGLGQTDLRRAERLADTIGRRDDVSVHHRHVQPAGVTRDEHCLVEVRKAARHRRPRAATTDDEDANSPAKQLGIYHVHRPSSS